jgi:Mg2+/citrate symporter
MLANIITNTIIVNNTLVQITQPCLSARPLTGNVLVLIFATYLGFREKKRIKKAIDNGEVEPTLNIDKISCEDKY